MIRKAHDCNIEYREHMRDGDGTVQITNFITGPEELQDKVIIGLLHQEEGRPEYCDEYQKIIQKAGGAE